MSQDSFFSGSDADAALIGPMGSSNISRWVYLTPTSVAPMFSQASGDANGDLVCLSGRMAAAVRCGTVVNNNLTINLSGYWLYHQRRANYAYQFGDSGGAIYYASTAKGIQSGCLDVTGDGVCDPNQPTFTHISYANLRTGAVVNTTNCGNYC
jgi:hypothetical protein